jgi:hypothetical protein
MAKHDKLNNLDNLVLSLLDYDLDYGKITVYETSNNFIIKTYNAGWSINEEVDIKLSSNPFKIYSYHPIVIYVIPKLFNNYKIITDNFEITKIKYFKYTIEVDKE